MIVLAFFQFQLPMQSVLPKDGAVHIVLHHMPAGLNWVLASLMSTADNTYQFLARDLDVSKPPPARIFELRIRDGRVDIDVEGSHTLVLNAQMPLHTKIFL